MLLLETVAHCWQYERCLAFHLSAFLLSPPVDCRLRATVFYTPADLPVVETLEYFSRQTLPPTVEWNFQPIDQGKLLRRAIGRNLAALATSADFVLFSDVDYLFGPGAIDLAAGAMAEVNAKAWQISWPRWIQSSVSHDAGDAELARVDRPQVLAVDPKSYETAKLPRPIGGAQWVPGDFCRRRGYLSDSRRWHRPATVWRRTFEDQAFRGWSGLKCDWLTVPNVYRIRHSQRGRDNVGCRN